MKKKSKAIAALLALAVSMTACLTGCGRTNTNTNADASEKTELVVFAAASMTETLNQIKTDYEAQHKDITLTYNFDSSGTLKTQIQEGATCDVFISAAQKQMDQLDASKDNTANPEQLDFINSDSRMDLLENKVVLVVPENNPKNINSFDDLKSKLESGDVLLAMGNSDVPVGQYTQKILQYWGLDEKALADAGEITYGSNVKEVTTQVSEGSADCGVVYYTDAYSAGLKIVGEATEEMCGKTIYPAAVMKNSEHPEQAQEFLAYLSSDAAAKVFEKVGFVAVA
ncbi:molybdate ABC transporter substrate-binding protein [Butyricicoccus intestinisimiae]|jgi:molybdate transport system substrate-binding protein|uniref:molybdate ABC transporter substrate-binding protein n=1 Tax=Butyricicoccus intestinisimiae TaxID=2841509 RepID=UPI002EA4F81D|nr:molybdate ABC transporter substrate-binding protein [Butyricicoccus sp.]